MSVLVLAIVTALVPHALSMPMAPTHDAIEARAPPFSATNPALFPGVIVSITAASIVCLALIVAIILHTSRSRNRPISCPAGPCPDRTEIIHHVDRSAAMSANQAKQFDELINAVYQAESAPKPSPAPELRAPVRRPSVAEYVQSSLNRRLSVAPQLQSGGFNPAERRQSATSPMIQSGQETPQRRSSIVSGLFARAGLPSRETWAQKRHSIAVPQFIPPEEPQSPRSRRGHFD